MNENTAKRIYLLIQQQPEETVFFAKDFADLGSPENVRKALERLNNRKKITRVAQGIYSRARQNPHIGYVLPSAEEVATAIAKRDRARILPSGSTALNALGLSTQVPMNIVLLTDGTARIVKVGKRTIKFKKTTPRNLAARGEISRLVVQGLKAIGKGNLTLSDEQKILELLRKEKYEDVRHDIGLAPAWIQQVMKKALQWTKTVYITSLDKEKIEIFLQIIPPEAVLAYWKNDYAIMMEEMIYEGNKPSFEALINELNVLSKRLHALDWKVGG